MEGEGQKWSAKKPPLVGRLLIEFSSQMTMERVQRENPNVTDGGRYTPPDCRPRWKVAIIIPFRHRENHLKYWLHYLHPILRRQRIDYGIYIINQVRPEALQIYIYCHGWIKGGPKCTTQET
ncbi:Beta-1,4-galactosyltransferase 2 [Liparis tanakae]|uniref:Beta-1,4-galactosyltransferase 2 n=1 Tax=Liparis tanakae TaxID=230148 RepID=A0A4Z2EJQ4_9TELE|nr:Beta-1,4-galactosyltransferase 2 [Liparis tanakae]